MWFPRKRRDLWKAKCQRRRAEGLEAEVAALREQRAAGGNRDPAVAVPVVALPVVARRPVPAAGSHGYDATTVGLFPRLILAAGVSLRGVPRVLSAVSAALGLDLAVPHGTTGRPWLLRVGHARLTWPPAAADGWAWLVDRSVQIGTAKCLVILGVRLSQLPLGDGQGRGPLRHRDLALVALGPADRWARADVDAALARAAARTGGPAPRRSGRASAGSSSPRASSPRASSPAAGSPNCCWRSGPCSAPHPPRSPPPPWPPAEPAT